MEILILLVMLIVLIGIFRRGRSHHHNAWFVSKCPHCRARIPSSAAVCSYCGRDVPPVRWIWQPPTNKKGQWEAGAVPLQSLERRETRMQPVRRLLAAFYIVVVAMLALFTLGLFIQKKDQATQDTVKAEQPAKPAEQQRIPQQVAGQQKSAEQQKAVEQQKPVEQTNEQKVAKAKKTEEEKQWTREVFAISVFRTKMKIRTASNSLKPCE
jgi:zinc-ribbon domain